MNLSDVITASILSKELGCAVGTAKSYCVLSDSAMSVPGSGAVFYSRKAVQDVLVDRNRGLLTFLEYQGLTQAPAASEENADA